MSRILSRLVRVLIAIGRPVVARIGRRRFGGPRRRSITKLVARTVQARRHLQERGPPVAERAASNSLGNTPTSESAPLAPPAAAEPPAVADPSASADKPNEGSRGSDTARELPREGERPGDTVAPPVASTVAPGDGVGAPPTTRDRPPPTPHDLEVRPGGRHDQGDITEDDVAPAATRTSGVTLPAIGGGPGVAQPTLETWLDGGDWVVGVTMGDATSAKRIHALSDSVTLLNRVDGERHTITPRELRGVKGATWLAFTLGRERGRLATGLRDGANLLLVPVGTQLPATGGYVELALLEPSPLVGFEAYEVYADGETTLEITINAEPIRVSSARGVPGFGLQGECLWPRAGRVCATYARPPVAVASDWTSVSTLVVGEEGIGQGTWRKALAMHESGESTDLDMHLDGFDGGWFFLRAYDAVGNLLDSLEFQFIRGLRSIEVTSSDGANVNTGRVKVMIEHDGHITVSGGVDAGPVSDDPSSSMRTVISTQFEPASRASPLTLARGTASVRVDVPNEQVWWCVSRDANEAPIWKQDLICLHRADVIDALSASQLLVLPPHGVPLSSLRLTAVGGLGHSWRMERATKGRHGCVKLREIGNAVHPDRAMRMELQLQPLEENDRIASTAIAYVQVRHLCKMCHYSTSSGTSMAKHLRSAHWNELVTDETLPSLRRRYPARRFPRRIWKCPHEGLDSCDGFFAPCFYDGDMTDEKIFEHLRKVHPTREHAVLVVHDLDEVREEYLRGLPTLIECKLCPAHSGTPAAFKRNVDGESEMMEHLLENHREELWTLR